MFKSVICVSLTFPISRSSMSGWALTDSVYRAKLLVYNRVVSSGSESKFAQYVCSRAASDCSNQFIGQHKNRRIKIHSFSEGGCVKCCITWTTNWANRIPFYLAKCIFVAITTSQQVSCTYMNIVHQKQKSLISKRSSKSAKSTYMNHTFTTTLGTAG